MELDILGIRMAYHIYLTHFVDNASEEPFRELVDFARVGTLAADVEKAKKNKKYVTHSDFFNLSVWKKNPNELYQLPVRKMSYAVSKDEVLKLLSNFKSFTDGFVGVSIVEGYYLKSIKNDSILRRIGLEPGDLVYNVNDERFSSFNTDFILAYFSVQEVKRFSMIVKRKTERIAISVAFAKTPPPTLPKVVPAAQKPGPQPPVPVAAPTAQQNAKPKK